MARLRNEILIMRDKNTDHIIAIYKVYYKYKAGKILIEHEVLSDPYNDFYPREIQVDTRSMMKEGQDG